jgi:hypothetical protein
VSSPADTAAKIATPAGLLDRANVHEIPKGSLVHLDGTVTAEDGSLVKRIEGWRPALGATLVSQGTAPTAFNVNWVEFAKTNAISLAGVPASDTFYGAISAAWTVPSAPKNGWHGQQMFFFSGVNGGYYIIQPVLAALDGGGWKIDVQMCGPAAGGPPSGLSMCAQTPFVGPVHDGDRIEGLVLLTSISSDGTRGTWFINVVDKTSGLASYAGYESDAPSQYSTAYSGVLEAYPDSARDGSPIPCNDYPSSPIEFDHVIVSQVVPGTTVFGLPNVTNVSNPAWTRVTSTQSPNNCGFAVIPFGSSITGSSLESGTTLEY